MPSCWTRRGLKNQLNVIERQIQTLFVQALAEDPARIHEPNVLILVLDPILGLG
jgi:hypothetical protein